MAVEINDARNKVLVDKRDQNKVIVQEQTTHVQISQGGPQGIPGPTGPTGPMGPSGLTASEIPALVSYTHNQSAASTTWTITHNLNFKPNVTVFDSGESMVEGSVTHTNNTTLTITFSAAISGRAHLS